MIDDEQIMEWSYSGKSEYDTNAYNRFQEVIINNFDVEEIFLQGSYANSTGVFTSSDVDIVVVCNGYYIDSYDRSTDLKRLKYDLYDAIDGSFNFHFELGRKTIKYQGSPKYSPVDILPCIRYVNRNGDIGIAFYDHSRNAVIVNYPKQHRDNGTEKNKRTGGSYKKTVRVFKNLRDNLIDERGIGRKTVPSYYLECLLYNVPDGCYMGYVPDGFYSVLGWLTSNKGSAINYRCQNGIHKLFNSFNGWNIRDYYIFLDAIQRWVKYA